MPGTANQRVLEHVQERLSSPLCFRPCPRFPSAGEAAKEANMGRVYILTTALMLLASFSNRSGNMGRDGIKPYETPKHSGEFSPLL